MTKIAICLRTLADLNESLGEKLDRVGSTASNSVQFDGFDDSDPSVIRDHL